MAKESRFFSHDLGARNDPNVLKARRSLGAKGYGIYFMLVEILHEQGGYIMKSNLEDVAWDIREDIESINDILNNFDLFNSDGERYWSDSALRRIEKVLGISEKRRNAAKAKHEKEVQSKSSANAVQVQSKCSAIDREIDTEINMPPAECGISLEVLPESVNREVVPLYPNDQQFERCWKAYGRKGTKAKALEYWKKISQPDRDIIETKIPDYVDATSNDPTFRKDFDGWINPKYRRWENEIPKQKLKMVAGDISPTGHTIGKF